jgi:hypothetical protein
MQWLKRSDDATRRHSPTAPIGEISVSTPNVFNVSQRQRRVRVDHLDDIGRKCDNRNVPFMEGIQQEGRKDQHNGYSVTKNVCTHRRTCAG